MTEFWPSWIENKISGEFFFSKKAKKIGDALFGVFDAELNWAAAICRGWPRFHLIPIFFHGGDQGSINLWHQILALVWFFHFWDGKSPKMLSSRKMQRHYRRYLGAPRIRKLIATSLNRWGMGCCQILLHGKKLEHDFSFNSSCGTHDTYSLQILYVAVV